MNRAYAWYALILLAALNVLNYVNRNVLFALFGPLQGELGVTDTQLGWSASAYVLVFSLAALPFGVLSDLRSRRAVITLGVVLSSAFTAANALVPTFVWLIVCRAGVGLGGAAFAGASQSLVADHFPGRRRAFAMAVLATGNTLGSVVGIWLGGRLEASYSWRTALLAIGLPGLALAPLTAHIREPTADTPRSGRAGRAGRAMLGENSTAGAVVADLRQALSVVRRTPTLRWVFVAGALLAFGMNGLAGWAPTLMARQFGLGVAEAAVLMGTWGILAGVAGSITGGMLADALRRRMASGRVVVLAAGLIIGAPLTIWLLTLRDLTLFPPVFSAALFFLSWFNGPSAAVIFDVVPPRVGATVAGAYLLFIHLAGDAVAFPLVGALSDRFGIERAVLLLPVVALVGGLAVLPAIGAVARDMERGAAARLTARSGTPAP